MVQNIVEVCSLLHPAVFCVLDYTSCFVKNLHILFCFYSFLMPLARSPCILYLSCFLWFITAIPGCRGQLRKAHSPQLCGSVACVSVRYVGGKHKEKKMGKGAKCRHA